MYAHPLSEGTQVVKKILSCIIMLSRSRVFRESSRHLKGGCVNSFAYQTCCQLQERLCDMEAFFSSFHLQRGFNSECCQFAYSCSCMHRHALHLKSTRIVLPDCLGFLLKVQAAVTQSNRVVAKLIYITSDLPEWTPAANTFADGLKASGPPDDSSTCQI